MIPNPARSHRALLRASGLSAGACALALALPGCGGEPNLDSVPTAKAGCEEPTAQQLSESSLMLPGRNCMDCHKSGGQAADYPWTAAGTVYQKAGSGKTCNTGGADGVTVEILDAGGTMVLASLTTNAAGNFFFAKNEFAGTSPVRARVRKGTMTRTMASAVNVAGGCASCHFPGGAAGDRIYLE